MVNHWQVGAARIILRCLFTGDVFWKPNIPPHFIFHVSLRSGVCCGSTFVLMASSGQFTSWEKVMTCGVLLQTDCAAIVPPFPLYCRARPKNNRQMSCQPLEGTYMRVLSITFTLSKIYEWLDTMFLVKLGRRPFNPYSAKGHTYSQNIECDIDT